MLRCGWGGEERKVGNTVDIVTARGEVTEAAAQLGSWQEVSALCFLQWWNRKQLLLHTAVQTEGGVIGPSNRSLMHKGQTRLERITMSER